MRQKDQKVEEPQPNVEVPKAATESQSTKEQNAQPEGPKMDVHQKITLLKDHHDDFEQHIAHIKHQPRKPINIPICDVRIDHDYNEHVAANYTPPISYVKYIKSIVDDTDLTIDYHADADDLVSSHFLLSVLFFISFFLVEMDSFDVTQSWSR